MTSKNRDDIVLDDGQQMCATIGTDGHPIYFAIDEKMTDYEVSCRAFEVKHNRPPSNEELTMLAMIERNKTNA